MMRHGCLGCIAQIKTRCSRPLTRPLANLVHGPITDYRAVLIFDFVNPQAFVPGPRAIEFTGSKMGRRACLALIEKQPAVLLFSVHPDQGILTFELLPVKDDAQMAFLEPFVNEPLGLVTVRSE